MGVLHCQRRSVCHANVHGRTDRGPRYEEEPVKAGGGAEGG